MRCLSCIAVAEEACFTTTTHRNTMKDRDPNMDNGPLFLRICFKTPFFAADPP